MQRIKYKQTQWPVSASCRIGMKNKTGAKSDVLTYPEAPDGILVLSSYSSPYPPLPF